MNAKRDHNYYDNDTCNLYCVATHKRKKFFKRFSLLWIRCNSIIYKIPYVKNDYGYPKWDERSNKHIPLKS